MHSSFIWEGSTAGIPTAGMGRVGTGADTTGGAASDGAAARAGEGGVTRNGASAARNGGNGSAAKIGGGGAATATDRRRASLPPVSPQQGDACSPERERSYRPLRLRAALRPASPRDKMPAGSNRGCEVPR